MNDLPPDMLSRVITYIERAGDMLVAEFHHLLATRPSIRRCTRIAVF
jgi:hypothetical protein